MNCISGIHEISGVRSDIRVFWMISLLMKTQKKLQKYKTKVFQSPLRSDNRVFWIIALLIETKKKFRNTKKKVFQSPLRSQIRVFWMIALLIKTKKNSRNTKKCFPFCSRVCLSLFIIFLLGFPPLNHNFYAGYPASGLEHVPDIRQIPVHLYMHNNWRAT